MRKLFSIAALSAFALAACSKPAPAPEASASAGASEAASAAATPAAAASPAAGTYDVTSSDGKTKSTVTINADGTYSDKVGNALPTSGLVKIVDGKTCFDPSGKAEAVCWTDGPHAADGSFTATDPKGNSVTVKPAAAAVAK